MAFENNVSRMVRELVFDCHLIAGGPKGPAQRPYAAPQHTPEATPLSKEDPTKVRGRIGIPGLCKGLMDDTPGKASQMALEKDVVGIFMLATERARAIRRPMSNGNVVRRREAIAKKLP